MRVMGVDLGVRKIAYALWDNGVLTETMEYTSNGNWRQTQLEDVADYIAAIKKAKNPKVTFIEDVLIGNNRKYSMQLAETKGAVLSRFGSREVYMVNVSTWKKEVVGNGKADKEAIRSYLYDRDSAYAALCGSSQDRFDAACIGYYGVVTAHKASLLEER